jgi:1,4-alpha-glucan branching enzyme
VQTLIADINNGYRNNPSLWQKDVMSEGFQWLIGDDGAGNTLAFARWADDGSCLISITNFSPVPHENYRLPVPVEGQWREALNTDATNYGGSGVLNPSLHSLKEEHRGQPYSIVMKLPPLATVWLKTN